MTEIARDVFDLPDLDYWSRTRIRGIAGYEEARFIRLILALEVAFGVVPREDEVDSIVTLGDIVRLLRSKINQPPD